MARLKDVFLRRWQPFDKRVEGLDLWSVDGSEGSDGDWVPVSGGVPDEEGNRLSFTACVVNFVFVGRWNFCVEQVGNKDIWSS